MSRVHDALRRVEGNPPRPPAGSPGPNTAASPRSSLPETPEDLKSLLEKIEVIPYTPSPDASLLDPARPNETPGEEFRSLRTRLNHLQSLQPIHNLVITSASPAEGKSFTAANLALAQSQLEGNRTLLADFDFRRPVVHSLFQTPRSPGITDYLRGKATLDQCIKQVEGTNLYLLPAGEAVLNPLELLNLPEVKNMLDRLPLIFNWVLLDTPPLLFAADANLLSTLTHGLVLVARIGVTTIDSVTRAIGSLCKNNMIGVVVNGADKTELYSKYTYYHSYYYSKGE